MGHDGYDKLKFLLLADLAALLLFFTLATNALAGGLIVLNTANAPPNTTMDDTGICDRVLKEAFKRIGFEIKINHLPSERALINANDGIDDGNFARVEGLDKRYPNLVRVPEEITRFSFKAFSRKLNFISTGWDSLKPYNVGIITGWKILEANIAGSKSLTSVYDENILFNLLASDRVDLVVYDGMQGMAFLKKNGLRDIHALGPPLAEKSMYLYLHRKHRELIPRLTEVLRAMKKEGEYAALVRRSLRDLPASAVE